MSYWRKLFIVVPLVLSLPVQSFAAVSMKCGSSHSVRDVPSAHEEAARSAAHHHDHAAMMAGPAGHYASAHLQHRDGVLERVAEVLLRSPGATYRKSYRSFVR